ARHRYVALNFEVGDRLKAVAGPGMARGEGQVADLGVGSRIAQIVRATVERVAAAVDPQESKIKVVAGEVEICGIADEARDRLLGREPQPHILIAPVLV